MNSVPVRNALIAAGSRLPYLTACRLKGSLLPGLEFDDLVGAGNLGLCKAARTFDRSRGVAFSTYAIKLVRSEMFEMLRDWDFYSRRARKIAEDADTELPRVTSLDAPGETVDADTSPLAAFVIDDHPGPEALALDSAEHASRARLLCDCLPCLTPRERTCLRRYYGGEQSMKTIAETLGVSESRVFQVLQGALLRLRADSRLSVLR